MKAVLRIIAIALPLWLGLPLPAVGEAADGRAAVPGRLLDRTSPEFEEALAEAWAYRHRTYEIYHQDSKRLASLAYALARHSGDIDGSMSPERFVAGVKGFHYQIGQVCDWLNDLAAGRSADPGLDELVLVGLLLQDKVMVLKGGRFVPAGPVRHVLGAAPGQKRSFAANLQHERLHILWDEDAGFREKALKDWEALSSEEKDRARRQLPQYPAEAQIIEEWAVARAENSTK